MMTKKHMAKTANEKIRDTNFQLTTRRGEVGRNELYPRTLADHGVYFFNGGVDDISIYDPIKYILEANLDPECPWDYITFIINSPGGYCTDGFALIDVIMGSRIPIRTVGIGMIASMGLQIFLAGQQGTRTLTPNCMILSHQFAGGSSGKEHELVAARKEQDDLSEIIMRHYKRTTGLDDETIKEYLLPPDDIWLNAKEAKKLGLCDIIKDIKPSQLNGRKKKTTGKEDGGSTKTK